jgi:hypothetical protein
MNVRWRIPVLAGATFALVTACGAGPAGNTVASLSSPSATPSGQQASDGRSDEDKIRDFTKCMKDHGVDIPEPTEAPKGGSTNGSGGAGIIVQGNGPDKEKIDKANDACRPLLPNGGQPPKLDAKQLDDMRKMAQCMREHGVNMPDPDPNKPGMLLPDGQQVDPDVMDKATKACAPAGAEIHTQRDPGGGSGPKSDSGGSTGGSSGGSK